jgi:hypothetical protein
MVEEDAAEMVRVPDVQSRSFTGSMQTRLSRRHSESKVSGQRRRAKGFAAAAEIRPKATGSTRNRSAYTVMCFVRSLGEEHPETLAHAHGPTRFAQLESRASLLLCIPQSRTQPDWNQLDRKSLNAAQPAFCSRKNIALGLTFDTPLELLGVD